MAIKRRTEIECILCKNIIKFPEYVGEDFRVGDLLCDTCESLLRIKLNNGEVQEFTVVKNRWEKWKESKPSKRLIELQDEMHRLKYPEEYDKGGG